MQFVRPFAARLEEWNGRAAMISATALARAHAGDGPATSDRLAALLAEVQAGYDALLSAMRVEQPHGRIDDVRAAYERLLATLRSQTAG